MKRNLLGKFRLAMALLPKKKKGKDYNYFRRKEIADYFTENPPGYFAGRTLMENEMIDKANKLGFEFTFGDGWWYFTYPI